MGAPPETVRPGIEVLVGDSVGVVAGRRVGLITNRSGVDRDGRSSIDVLHGHDDVELVALFSPEHGIRGTAPEGRRLGDEIDADTGLPVFSLYGETLFPTPEMLAGVDVLLFDVQDIGSRYYTYVSTMALSMRAAGDAGVPFVVLDRPNPIGAPVQGPLLDPDFATFVGLFPVPVRHGMTAGELARLYRGEFGIEADLTVVPVEGWTRDTWFDETDLPWIAPSRNMPTIESAAHYPGTCLFEGTNLSVGRGTSEAFRHVGAPWLDAEVLAARLAARGLPGVRIEPTTFVPEEPTDGKFGGEAVHGVRLTVVDRESYDPVRTGIALLIEARELSGGNWAWNERHFDRLIGTDRVRIAIDGGADLEEVTRGWDEDVRAFETLRAPYLLYR